jgi:alanine dehydrogenase
MIESERSGKAAFEVSKGPQRVDVLSEETVARVLDPGELLRELEVSFGALARGEVQCPPRPQISIPGRGFSLAMAAWQSGMQICVKVVNVFDGNLLRGLPNHLAIVNLFDPETGAVTCVMDATYITAIRTAAAAVLSHQLLSRPESRVATILGAGVQAREHLRLLPLVRVSTRSKSARSSSNTRSDWPRSRRRRTPYATWKTQFGGLISSASRRTRRRQ